MIGHVTIWIDGVPRLIEEGVTVAAALIANEVPAFRRDLSGEPRWPLCGMGSCMECRVTIDGVSGRRSCAVSVASGMQIGTES